MKQCILATHFFFLLLAPMLAFAAGAPEKPFNPFSEEDRLLYRFDLKKNFYQDEAAWKADLEKARGMISQMEGYRGKLASGPKELLGYMELKAALTDLVYRLYAYGEFVAAVDTSDRKAYEAYEELVSEIEARTSFAKVELLSLTPEMTDSWSKDEPRLKQYRYAVEDVARMAPHTLSAKEESVLAKLGPDLTSWQEVLFQKVFDKYSFAKIKEGEKELDACLDYETLVRSKDRQVREKAFREYYKGLRALSDLAGFALAKEMKAYNTEARMRGFDNYYNQSLFERYLTRPQVDNLYLQIEAHLPLYRDYLAHKMSVLQRELKLDKAELWDMEMTEGGAVPPKFTAREGGEILTKALGVLGPEYSSELGKLLDPKNGRMDIVGGPHRNQGAFCEAYFGYFMDNYQGLLLDVATMGHEAGHAIHHQLEFNHRKTLMLGDGPGYMTESFAAFNEWLLKDYLFKTEKDPALLKTYHKEALNDMMYLWEIARRAKFEMVSYDRVAEGKVNDAAGFNSVCMEVGKPYDPFFERYKEMEVHWMRKHHYWSVPTYYVNYVVAHILALKYYQLYKDDPVGFPKKYVDMVKNGFDRPAAQCLKDFLGVDLNDPKLLEGAFDMIQKEFETVKAAK